MDVAAGANLQAVVDAAPDGTEFRFPVNGSFTVSAGITLNGRHNLIFTGNGSTIRTTGSGGATLSSPFVMGYFTISTDIWVRGFDLEGNNPRTGTDIYGGGSQHGLAINGGLRIEISGNTIRHTWGDAIYANANTNGGNNWPTDLWAHDNTFDYIGRNAFTMNSARRARLDHNTADHIAFSLLDIEPDLNTQGVQDVFLRNNTVGVWGLSPNYTTYLVAAANQSNDGTQALIDGVTVTGNVVTVGSPTSPNNPNNGGIRMYFAHPGRASRITVTDNQSPKGGTGLVYAHVDGLTYGRNTQAGTAAPVSVSDCTSVVVVN